MVSGITCEYNTSPVGAINPFARQLVGHLAPVTFAHILNVNVCDEQFPRRQYVVFAEHRFAYNCVQTTEEKKYCFYYYEFINKTEFPFVL